MTLSRPSETSSPDSDARSGSACGEPAEESLPPAGMIFSHVNGRESQPQIGSNCRLSPVIGFQDGPPQTPLSKAIEDGQRGKVAEPVPAVLGCNHHHGDIARVRSVFRPAPRCCRGHVLVSAYKKEDSVCRHRRIGKEVPSRSGFVPRANWPVDEPNPTGLVTWSVCPQLVANWDGNGREIIEHAFHA